MSRVWESGRGMERDDGRGGERRGGLRGRQRPIKAEKKALGQDQFCTSHELKSTCQTIIDSTLMFSVSHNQQIKNKNEIYRGYMCNTVHS